MAHSTDVVTVVEQYGHVGTIWYSPVAVFQGVIIHFHMTSVSFMQKQREETARLFPRRCEPFFHKQVYKSKIGLYWDTFYEQSIRQV